MEARKELNFYMHTINPSLIYLALLTDNRFLVAGGNCGTLLLNSPSLPVLLETRAKTTDHSVRSIDNLL